MTLFSMAFDNLNRLSRLLQHIRGVVAPCIHRTKGLASFEGRTATARTRAWSIITNEKRS